jgi:predicted ferric reductase
VLIKGHATDGREIFEFTIADAHTGNNQLRLDIKYSGDHGHGLSGAGLWPNVEKAKSVAQETANKLLGGAVITWETI